MKKQTFIRLKTVVTVALAAGIAMSVVTGNWMLPIVLIIGTFVLLLVMKRTVTEVMEDERDRKVSGQAAIMAMTVFAPAAAVIGVTLIIWGKTSPTLFASGNTLLYATAAFVFLHVLLFKWYARKQDRH